MSNQDKPVYVLLRDLPNMKVGAEFIFDGKENYYNANGIAICFYNRHVMENNPDWFKLKEEPICSIIFRVPDNPNIWEKRYEYKFFTKEEIPDIKLSEIKLAIEKVLNQDTEGSKEGGVSSETMSIYLKAVESLNPKTEQPKDKEYEILSFTDGINKYILNFGWGYYQHNNNPDGYVKLKLEYLLKNKTFKINSVQRLSDNEIFSVGDEVESIQWGKQIIKGFIILPSNYSYSMVVDYGELRNPLFQTKKIK